MLEIIVSQDDSKSTYQRTSVGILDLLGDIGGVMEMMSMVTIIFGEFFSRKFFSGAIASELYV